MSSRKTTQIESGCRARTNAAFARIMDTPRHMTVIKPDRHVRGCWVVRWDGVQPLQYIHQKFIERIEQ